MFDSFPYVTYYSMFDFICLLLIFLLLHNVLWILNEIIHCVFSKMFVTSPFTFLEMPENNSTNILLICSFIQKITLDPIEMLETPIYNPKHTKSTHIFYFSRSVQHFRPSIRFKKTRRSNESELHADLNGIINNVEGHTFYLDVWGHSLVSYFMCRCRCHIIGIYTNGKRHSSAPRVRHSSRSAS